MSLSLGIVGLPNVGKSTLFNAITKKQVNISNYPFCTIDPNIGVVKVPDERLDKLAEVFKPKQILPTTIEFVDIAGLVKNAYLGEGLGNQFLANIREVDAVIEVVRVFQDTNVAHVAGKVDPRADKETINLELILADLQTVSKRLDKVKKEVKSGDKNIIKLPQVLEKLKNILDQGKRAQDAKLDNDEQIMISDLNLLTFKPILFVYNIGPHPDPLLLKEREICLNIKQEQELAELSKTEQTELGMKSELNKLIKASFQLLDLVTFFTVQNQILQAWTIIRNTKAPQAAGKIHTDFKAGFIRAETINWQDLLKAGSEAKARERGLIRTEGKEYIINDGDVCHFLYN